MQNFQAMPPFLTELPQLLLSLVVQLKAANIPTRDVASSRAKVERQAE